MDDTFPAFRRLRVTSIGTGTLSSTFVTIKLTGEQVDRQRAAVLEALLAAGADVDGLRLARGASHPGHEWMHSPLERCVMLDSPRSARVLLDAGAALGDPIFMPAVLRGNAAVLRVLLQHPRSRQHLAGTLQHGGSLLSYAVFFGHEECVRVLLSDAGDALPPAQQLAIRWQGYTPLQLALKRDTLTGRDPRLASLKRPDGASPSREALQRIAALLTDALRATAAAASPPASAAASSSSPASASFAAPPMAAAGHCHDAAGRTGASTSGASGTDDAARGAAPPPPAPSGGTSP
jgi:hypothetical protein